MRAFLESSKGLANSYFPHTCFDVLVAFWGALEVDVKEEDFLVVQRRAYQDASRHLKGMDFLPPFASLQLNCKNWLAEDI